MTDPARNEAPPGSAAAEAPAPATANAPGARLAAARITHGLSIEGVAHQLKFSPRQIEALEGDRYDALPGVAVVRGMVRGYARLVQLDAEPLLEALRDAMPTPDANRIIDRYREPVPFSDGAKRSNVVYVVFTVAVLAVAALVLVQWRQERPEPARMSFVPAAKTPPEPARSTVASVGEAVPPSGETVPAAAPVEPQAGAAAAPDAASTTGGPPPEAAADAKDNDAAPTEPTGDRAAAEATQTAAAAGSAEPTAAGADATAPAAHRVELEFLGDSWVEIRDADGKVVHSQLNAGGSTVRVEGKAPLSFVIGNAQEVRLRYDGRSVDLAPFIRVAVARFTLK
jgi:cytoskeleton protein RodZ